MAKVADKEITDIVSNYIKELEKNNIHIKKAYLFGSYAKGNYDKWSDIDVALVSDDFEGIRFWDRKKIARITRKIDSRISPWPYKTEDFTSYDPFVHDEIIDCGVKIR